MLEAFVSKKRDRKAALKFLRKLRKRYPPRPDAIITDRLRSYRAALRELGRIQSASSWPMAEHSCGEFPPAVPAARTREAPFQADAKPPEFYHRPFFRLQPLQPATTSLFTGHFQAQPRRCTCPVASTRGGLIPCPRWNNSDLRFYSDSALPTGREAKEAGAVELKGYFCSNLDSTLSRHFRRASPPIDHPRLPPAVRSSYRPLRNQSNRRRRSPPS